MCRTRYGNRSTALFSEVSCGRHCTCNNYRGHDESDTSYNKGNFREILDVVASENPELANHMSNIPKNAK